MKLHNFFKKLLFINGLILFVFNSAYAASIWQGEWGTWTAKPGVEFEEYYNSDEPGANVSIYDCNSSGACSFRLASSAALSDMYGKLFIISPALAEGIIKSNSDPKECKLQFGMDENGKSLRIIKREGGYPCNNYYPQVYPLRTHDTYKVHKKGCYLDLSPARQVMCRSDEIADLDNKLIELITFDVHNPPADNDSSDDQFDDFYSYSKWLKRVIKECEKSKNIQECLLSSYKSKVASLQQILDKRKNAEANDYNSMLVPGDPAIASKVIDKIQGIYENSSEESQNILEIVRVKKDIIYFNINLSIPGLDGHGGFACEAHGIARYKKDNLFLYRDRNIQDNYGKDCLFTISPSTNGVNISASNLACAKNYCGNNHDDLNDIDFTYNQRKPIQNMKEVLNSYDYKFALENFQKILQSGK